MGFLIFVLAIVNNALLAAIFIARGRGRMPLVRRLGIAYLALAAPGAAALLFAIAGPMSAEHIIFLAIFLAYLFIEWLYDYALKLDFRANWKLLIPYAALYIASCYGFFVLNWRQSAAWGIVVLVLTAVQLTANILTHKKKG